MTRKPEPGGRKNNHLPPGELENVGRKLKHGETSKGNSNVLTAQRVVRSVSEATVVHFYLACGHLITISKSELVGTLPGEMRCWACAEDK
jgi:hypothetical protein